MKRLATFLATLFLSSPASALIGAGGSGFEGNVCPQSWLFISEVLSAPRQDGITLSIIPRVTSQWYLEWADTKEDLLRGVPDNTVNSAASPASVTSGVRQDFSIKDALQPDTRYYYRLKCRISGTPNPAYMNRPIYTFRTLPGKNARWKFAISSDSHVLSAVISNESQCGTLQSEGLRTHANGVGHLAEWAIRENLLFYMHAGDEQMPHQPGTSTNPCTTEYAPGLFTDMRGGVSGSTQTEADNEAKAHYAKWLQLWGGTSAVLPIMNSIGNHDADVTSWTDVTSDNLHTVMMGNAVRTARTAYYANPVSYYYPNGRTSATDAEGPVGLPGTCDNCDANALFYAFEAGDALFTVADIMVNSGDSLGSGGTGRHPNSFDDWDLGMDGCTTAGTDCPAGEQGYWIQKLVETSSKAFKFFVAHHVLGGMPTSGAVHYGRGGMLTTTSMPMGGRCIDIAAPKALGYCIRAGAYCPSEFTAGCSCDESADCSDEPASTGAYVPGDYGYCVSRAGVPYVETEGGSIGMGRSCGVGNPEQSCDSITGNPDDYNCAWGFAGRETDPFAGQQEIFHQSLKLAALDDDGASFMTYGHDHFEAWDQKCCDKVHFVLGGKFTRNANRVNWADDRNVHSQYRYRASTPIDTACEGIGCGGVYDQANSCLDGEGCGDTKRGFTVVEVFKDESVVLRKYSNEDLPFNDLGSPVAHMVYEVDESRPSTTDRHADASFAYIPPGIAAQSDDSADTSYQFGSNDLLNGGASVLSSDVPGIYGPTGGDPRLSLKYDGDLTTVGHWAVDAANNFAYLTSGTTTCTFFKAESGKVHTFSAKTDADASPIAWSMRYDSTNNFFRVASRGVNTDSVVVAGATPLAWHHYCIAWGGNGKQVKFWLDGAPVACSTNCTPASITLTGSGNLIVGATNTNQTIDVDGWIHDFVIYDEELRTEEVCKLARCGSRNTLVDSDLACELPPGQHCAFQ